MTFLQRLLSALYPQTPTQETPMPTPIKLAIVYYSTYGTNHAMAEAAAEAARQAGAEVRVVKVRETAPQDVVNSQDA